MKITTLLLLLTTVGLLFLYFLKKNNEKRKENLNIVKEGDKLHFFLSDDHFLSIKLEDNNIITNDVSKHIMENIETMSRSVRKISFVNFRNEILKERLNGILEQKKYRK